MPNLDSDGGDKSPEEEEEMDATGLAEVESGAYEEQ